jgi:hypothetical protein
MGGQTLRRFEIASRLGRRESAFLSRAFWELALARVRFATRTAEQILNQPNKGSSLDTADPKELDELRAIGWAIGAVARRLPWRADCIIQAMAAERWLCRLGYKPTLVLGVQRLGPTLRAHAVLQCEGLAVTGGTSQKFVCLRRSPFSGGV